MDEHNIPIDIHANKLSDWLTSRRHCSKTWQNNILEIREKINNAIQDMPRHDGIVKLLTGTRKYSETYIKFGYMGSASGIGKIHNINYFHCLKIVEILKETEADSKNLFGRYGSQRMRDWQEIVKLYERDNIYLAEAAQMLQRNVSYEIPSIKKQISKLEQLQAECSKKSVDCIKTEKNILNEFNNQCKHLNIPGKKVKRELVGLLKELPDLYKSAAESVKSLKPAIELYEAFVEFTGKKVENYFAMISYVMENGNTTTYEWKYGEKPKEIIEPDLNIKFDDEINENDTIDFGDDIDIDFGAEIDYGEITVEDNIDWDITTDAQDESGIETESKTQDSIATGEEAYTILDNPSTRSKYTDELVELEAFLKMRLYELSTTSEMDALSQLQAGGSTILQLQTTESITSLLANVQGALVMMTNDRIQHLHSIKHSPKYVDYLAYSLDQKLVAIEKAKATEVVMKQRKDDALEQQIKLQDVLKIVIKKTKELQLQIENDISKKYKGREVNLMGGVNAI